MRKSQTRTVKSVLQHATLILCIILVFTLFDYLIHSLSNEYAVPGYYYRNKIVFGTLLGIVAYVLFRKKPLPMRSLLFSATIAVLLQTRYYLEGYPKDFVFLFLLIHFLILLPVSLLAFGLFEKHCR